MTASPAASSVSSRLVGVLRDITRGGLAGLLAGAVVGGLGGRLMMTAAALLNPQATGLRTENGELIGSFTLNGTLALVVFGGLAAGIVAGVVWVVVAPWIPGRGLARVALAGLVGIALGGFRLVEATNQDFIVLGRNQEAIVAGLVLLVGLVAAATAWFDARLDRRLPHPQRLLSGAAVAYVVISLVGLAFVPQIAQIYLDPAFSRHTPGATGWALVVVAAATGLAWLRRVRTGSAEPLLALVAAGRIGLVVAAVLGGQFLWGEIADIVDLG